MGIVRNSKKACHLNFTNCLCLHCNNVQHASKPVPLALSLAISTFYLLIQSCANNGALSSQFLNRDRAASTIHSGHLDSHYRLLKNCIHDNFLRRWYRYFPQDRDYAQPCATPPLNSNAATPIANQKSQPIYRRSPSPASNPTKTCIDSPKKDDHLPKTQQIVTPSFKSPTEQPRNRHHNHYERVSYTPTITSQTAHSPSSRSNPSIQAHHHREHQTMSTAHPRSSPSQTSLQSKSMKKSK